VFKLNEKNIGQFNLISTLLILVIFASTFIYLSIESKKDNFYILKNEIKNRFIEDKKQEIKFKVEHTNQLINENAKESIKILKETIKDRVSNAYKIAYKIYQENKADKTNQEIINIIKEVLRPVRFDNQTGYIFMTSLDGIEILFPVAKDIENTNVYNLQDKKGNFVIQEEIKLVKEKNEGYIKDFWLKPQAQNKEMIYPKLTYVKGLKELNLYIGTGRYIDEANKQTKKYIQNLITQLNKKDSSEYIIISELLNINGGDKFAKILVHPTATIGKLISDDKKDLYGKYYRKEYLKGLKENGKTFLKYSYINPQTKKEMSKISYFVLNKEWNWIIGAGFHDDLIDQEIAKWQENLDDMIKNNIYKYITLFLVFSLILFILIYIINRFTKNTILEYKKRVLKKQEELNKINNDLEKRVNNEVQKNINTQEQLFKSEKLASMGEMIGNIAHQWRQPLSVISTASTGIKIQKELNVLTDELLEENCNAINTNAQYLSKTIDDFRNFIKGDRDKSLFNLEKNIETFLNLVDGSIKSNNINVILDLEKNISVNGYENELIQCFINIYNNAKDILNEKDIDKKLIFVSTSLSDNNAVIKIKDNAGGIPNDIINKIFDPYFTTKHKSQGTGLGLHMTYNLIVDGMHGEIKAVNEEYKYNGIRYKGASFIITIPLH